MNRWFACLWVGLVALFAIERSTSAGSEHRVVLLRPPATDEVTTMALARIRGELIAAGFEVTLLPQREQLPPRTAVETAAPELRPLAVFAIFRDQAVTGATPTAEIWVSDRVVDRTSVERMRLDGSEPERGATVLAVRAVELLKASLAEFWVAPDRPPPKASASRPPVMKDTAPTISPRPRADEGFAVEGALGLLHSFGEIGPAWMPVLSVAYGAAGGYGARASVGALGTEPVVEATAGTGKVEQQLGTIEAFVSSRWQGPVQFFGSAGVGAHHLRVEGTGISPFRGKTEEAWSFLSGVGLGMSAEVYPNVALIVEGQSLWAWRSIVLRIADTELGRRHWPILLVRTGVGVTF